MKAITLKAGALALGLVLAGCGDAAAPTAEATDGPTATSDNKTLATVLSDADGLGTVKGAIESAELGSLFEGPASYTLLAPNDAAFEALGEDGKALMEPGQKAMLVAVLRNHMVPGHLTPEAIEKAITDKGGSVTMTTLGDGAVTFRKDGDAITATSGDGTAVRVAGAAMAGNNGVVIPLDGVLMPKAAAATASGTAAAQ